MWLRTRRHQLPQRPSTKGSFPFWSTQKNTHGSRKSLAFTSEVVEQFCSQFGISKSTTTTYHSQGNSQVERAHQTLGRMIGKLENEYKGQWPRYLLKLTHAYNSTSSTITAYSPNFLIFGQQPQLPINFMFPTHEVMGTLRPVDSYVAVLITALRKAFKVAQNMTQMESLRKK